MDAVIGYGALIALGFCFLAVLVVGGSSLYAVMLDRFG
jgi:hypothetical protein